MLKHILVGVAGTPSLEAKIATAIDLAKRHEARISVLSILDIAHLRNVGAVPLGAAHHAQKMKQNRIEKSHAAAEKAIERFQEACAEAGIPLETLRQEGPPLDILTQHWRYHDLCLLDVRGWFDCAVLPDPGDSLLQLIALGVRPLLSVNRETTTIGKVMIAYNGSIESAKAMKHYAQFNPWPEAAHQVVCVGDPKSGENAEDMLAHAVDYLAGHGLKAQAHHETGHINSPIHDMSRELGADLTVMGSSFRRILTFKRFGTHARTMIEKSNCALFMSH